jgi:outer membrane protein assembly factor BamB
MIDDDFSRGPCDDQPVCVNRLTNEWIHCSVLETDDTKRKAWSGWGGPNEDFTAEAETLAMNWSEGEPRKLWSRPLGEGYSAVLFERGRLYTMHRVGDSEAVICLDAGTGETIWEQVFEPSPTVKHGGYGTGPRSTPLIVGEMLFTIGAVGTMRAVNKQDGEIVWSHELWGEEFGGNFHGHGYSSSPVAYKDTVIVTVGGENAGIVAFDQRDGSVKWKALNFKNSHSSPRIVDVAGERQLMVFMSDELIGVNPDNGELRWRYPHVNQWGHNISMPTVLDEETIFLSSIQVGARGIRLTRDGETIEARQTWSERRIQFYHGSTVRQGDWVYGSSGSMGPAFMAAVNIRSGEIGWRERGFARANCVGADGKLIILDEDGMLYLARATPEELVVLDRTQLLNKVAWTVPTIVGTTLYVRDNEQILAVDLGPKPAE